MLRKLFGKHDTEPPAWVAPILAKDTAALEALCRSIDVNETYTNVFDNGKMHYKRGGKTRAVKKAKTGTRVTALGLALLQTYAEGVIVLLDSGHFASVLNETCASWMEDTTATESKTPLGVALSLDRADMRDLLLRAGADPNVVAIHRRESPYQVADELPVVTALLTDDYTCLAALLAAGANAGEDDVHFSYMGDRYTPLTYCEAKRAKGCGMVLRGLTVAQVDAKLHAVSRAFEGMTVDDVCKHFIGLGAPAECIPLLRREKVDGARLLTIHRDDLTDASSVPRDVVQRHVEWLEARIRQLEE